MAKKGLLHLMALLLAFMPLIGVFAQEAEAATSRVAVIKSLKGTVHVKKAGGSKEFKAFAKMSLNEGDVLSTSRDGSAVLQFANGTKEDDQMTVSANTTLSFSKLSDRSGTRTKVSMWSGAAWVEVKSIAAPNDEFTMETPTAVMGVRGTHFMIYVHPVTGTTELAVFSGIVTAQPQGGNPAGSGGSSDSGSVPVYPAQQIQFNSETQPDTSSQQMTIVNLSDLISRADSEVLLGIIQSASGIQSDNDQLGQRILDLFNSGSGLPETLNLLARQDLERYQSNLDALISAVIAEAIKQGRISEDQIRQSLQDIPYDPDAQLQLTEEEMRRQEQLRQQEEQRRQAMEQRKEQRQQASDEILEQLRQQRDQQREANQAALTAKQQKALEEYERQLSEAERERFDRDRQSLQNDAASPSPETAAGGSGGGSGGGGGDPASPAPSANPLESLDLIYYLPPQPSESPAAERLPVALDGSQPIIDLPYLGEEYIKLLAKPKNAQDEILVLANDVPYPADAGANAQGEIEFRIPLILPSNLINVQVLSGEQSAKDAVSFKVNRASMPTGFGIEASGVEFEETALGYFVALMSPSEDSFELLLNKTADSSAFLRFDDDILIAPDLSSTDTLTKWIVPVTGQGLHRYNLSIFDQGKFYFLTLSVNKGSLSLPWESYDPDNPPFLLYDYYEDEIEPLWDQNAQTMEWQLGVEAEGPFALEYDFEQLHVLSVWSDRLQKTIPKGYYEGLSGQCSMSGYCLDVQPGMNTFKVYVTDPLGLQSYVYNFVIDKSTLPYGISEMRAGFAADAVLQPTEMRPLVYEEYSRIYHTDLSVTSSVYGKLEITVDESKLSRIGFINDGEDLLASEDLTGTGIRTLSFDFGQLNIQPGVNVLALVAEIDQYPYANWYEILVIAGELPEAELDPGIVSEPMEKLADERTYEIDRDTAQSILDFQVWNPNYTLVYLDDQLLDYDPLEYIYRASGLETGVYTFTIKQYNEWRIGEPTVYTVILYNGFQPGI